MSTRRRARATRRLQPLNPNLAQVDLTQDPELVALVKESLRLRFLREAERRAKTAARTSTPAPPPAPRPWKIHGPGARGAVPRGGAAGTRTGRRARAEARLSRQSLPRSARRDARVRVGDEDTEPGGGPMSMQDDDPLNTPLSMPARPRSVPPTSPLDLELVELFKQVKAIRDRRRNEGNNDARAPRRRLHRAPGRSRARNWWRC